jgi:hypothetical protein
MMHDDIELQLLEHLEPLVTPAARTWLAAGMARAATNGAGTPAPGLERLFPAARRMLGAQPVRAGATVTVSGDHVPIGGWQATDLGRALLLVRAAHREPVAALVTELFRQGDETERASIVRSLILLPDAASLKPIALEAGRVNSVALFSALALDNAYPATYYTDHEFNQLVLKAMFMGQPIVRVHGLAQRANAELARMSEDFYDERIAAKRQAPVDIWLALVPHASPRGLELAKRHLTHDDAGHRFHASLALRRIAAARPDLERELSERLRNETDRRVLRALQS